MKYIVRFEVGTLANFNKAINYYEKISDEFWDKINIIKENPLHYQSRYKNIRIAHLKVFPYGIHFIIDHKVIRIFKILHHKQYYK